jgi:hypothetical protein
MAIVLICDVIEHRERPAHQVRGMACLNPECGAAWRDCVGEFGQQIRTGCPRCSGRYWVSTRIELNYYRANHP